MNPDRIGVGGNIDVPYRIVSAPTLLGGIAEERRKRMQVVAESDVAHLRLRVGPPPRLERLNPRLVNQTNWLAAKENPQACEARPDPLEAIGMIRILELRP